MHKSHVASFSMFARPYSGFKRVRAPDVNLNKRKCDIFYTVPFISILIDVAALFL